MKNTRTLDQLTKEELELVYDKNKKLQYEVFSDYQESEMYWITEQLDCFRSGLSNWNIGFNNHNFISVKDNREFLRGLLKAQKDYGFLEDDFTPRIESLIEKYETLDNMEYDNKHYENLEAWLEKQIESLEHEVTRIFNQVTNNYDSKHILDYFIEFYVENRLEGKSFYVGDDYTLYEDVAYTKNYSV